MSKIEPAMNLESRIYIAGHRGLVGSAILKNLTNKGYKNLITRTHSELDLKDEYAVAAFFKDEKPEYVFLAAAKVGGIMANNLYRAQFIYENLQIQNVVIHQSYLNGIKKLLFLGSSCVYPKNAPQPIKESYLLTDTLEYTNEPYAIAKIAGMKMCEAYNAQYGTNFVSVMPTNLYGLNDNFHLENSHVLPGLMRKIHLSKLLEEGKFDLIRMDLELEKCDKCNDEELLLFLDKKGIGYSAPGDSTSGVTLKVWGSGKPLRELLWSDDMADACVFIMENIDYKDILPENNTEIRNTHINIGTGKEISIQELAFQIKDIVGFKGEILFDITKPDGTPRKLLDVSKLSNLGWKYRMELTEGIKLIYRNYINGMIG
jgi:GDP-L-fucose synthase